MVSGFSEHLIMFAFGYGGDCFEAIFGEPWDFKKHPGSVCIFRKSAVFVKIDLHAF